MFHFFYINLVNIVQKHTQKQKICLFMVHIQDLVYTYKGNLKLPFWESLVAYIVTTWTGEWREVDSNPFIKKVFFYHTIFFLVS